MKEFNKQHILLCLSRFGIGGIQTFVIQLANELVKSEKYEVSIYCHYPELVSTAENETIDPRIKIFTLSKSHYVVVIINHVRNILKKLVAFDFKEWLTEKYFLRLVKREKVSIIHSNIHITDPLAIQAKKVHGASVVISTHGSYNNEDQALIPLMKDIAYYVDAFVYTAERNLTFFQKSNIELPHVHFIPNGYKADPDNTIMNKTQMFEFGIMARGVEEKGWKELDEAIKILARERSDFSVKIIADGELPNQLFKDHETNNVEFIGTTTSYVDYLQTCNVCLLPTFLKDESMPFSVITYLALSKPVIATDVGSIKWMIQHEDQFAGTLLNLNESTGRVDVHELAESMRSYIINPDKGERLRSVAKKAFQKFSIASSAKQYSTIYDSLTTD